MEEKQLAVGQKWARSDGVRVLIEAVAGQPQLSPYRWLGSDNIWYDDSGACQIGPHRLVKLVSPSRARPTPSAGGTPSVVAPEILQAAGAHMQDRAATYDAPGGERSMEKTVGVFNLHHGTTITEAQGWHFMQILKDVRLFARKTFHQDSGEDGVAYAALKVEAKAKENTPEKEQKC